MNNLYFACIDCKIYIDAGYGWSHWSLEETGIVARGKAVCVDAVLSAEEYWTPQRSESSEWLYKEVLPSVRCFLAHHSDHCIVFGNTADFLADGLFDWMQIGFLPQLLPRYFVECLGLKTWDEVRDFISRQEAAPWWWMLEWDGTHDRARKKFHELIESKSSKHATCLSQTC